MNKFVSRCTSLPNILVQILSFTYNSVAWDDTCCSILIKAKKKQLFILELQNQYFLKITSTFFFFCYHEETLQIFNT